MLREKKGKELIGVSASERCGTRELRNLAKRRLSLVTANKTNIIHFLHHVRQVRDSAWRDCSREPPGQCENVKIIHKTVFSGVLCTIFKRLWITLWISYRTSCAWVRDKSRIFPQGSKTVQSCSLDTRCLSIQFSFRQLPVYSTFTVVIHRSWLPLLTTTMYTYSKPIKTLKPCCEPSENGKKACWPEQWKTCSAQRLRYVIRRISILRSVMARRFAFDQGMKLSLSPWRKTVGQEKTPPRRGFVKPVVRQPTELATSVSDHAAQRRHC